MDELVREMKDAEKTLKPCKCGGHLLIRYQPGVTFVACFKCGVVAKSPDWSPREVAKNYNKGIDGLG